MGLVFLLQRVPSKGTSIKTIIYNRVTNAIVINPENGTFDYNGTCKNIPSTINARAQYSYYTGYYNLEYFSRTGGRYLVYIKQDYSGAVQNLDVTVAAGGKIFSFGSAEGDSNNEILIREV